MNARSMLIAATAVVLLPLSAMSAQPAQEASSLAALLRPVDEGPRQPDFLAFRTRLRQTLARRDVSALIAVVHPDIKNGFGGATMGGKGSGACGPLMKRRATSGKSWVLDHGGTFDTPSTFVAPYVFSRWPEGFDSFEHLAVVGSTVNLRAGPSLEAGIVARRSFTILRRGGDGGDSLRSWTPVVLDDGRKAFVAPGLTRSPVDYRAYFVREQGAWLVAMFLAGD